MTFIFSYLLQTKQKVELHIDNLDIMLPLVDIVLVGKDYARYLGALNCTEAAEKICTRVEPGTICVCAWGEQGASYCVATSSPENLDIKTQSAYVPKQIVDSLGMCMDIKDIFYTYVPSFSEK